MELKIATLAPDGSLWMRVFNKMKAAKTPNWHPSVLSMGMSGDYKIAISVGSTMIRVGSNIFGTRNYAQSS